MRQALLYAINKKLLLSAQLFAFRVRRQQSPDQAFIGRLQTKALVNGLMVN
jgi:hypothetical protein